MSLASQSGTIDSGLSSAPSPELFIDTLMGFEKTAALRAAVEIGLFGAIADGAGDASALAAATGASERGVAILCDYLAALGFLGKAGDRYSLTPSSAVFLVPSSPHYLGIVTDFLASPEMLGLMLDDPAAYVRNGGAIGLANVAADNPVWVKFARAMAPLMAPATAAIAHAAAAMAQPPRKVLDIAAGHGQFGIAVAQAVPEASIFPVDWQIVLAVAAENAAKAGVAARYHPLPGSAFDVDWGKDYDLILIPHFLHHFDEATCIGLLEKIRRSLADGGKALGIEAVVSEDRLSPPWPAGFSFLMLGTTPRGKSYSARQLDELARAAGFAGAAVEPIQPSAHSLVTFL